MIDALALFGTEVPDEVNFLIIWEGLGLEFDSFVTSIIANPHTLLLFKNYRAY